jgi:branched-chain amino acid transport system permease protein
VTELIQQIVNALSLGGTYALLALGLAIVFSILRLVNFAHGELLTITGYAMLFLLGASLPFWLVVPLAVLAASVAAMLMERIAFRPVRGADPSSLLLTSLAVSIILQVIFQDTISARPRGLEIPSKLSESFVLGGIRIGVLQAISIAVTVVLLLLLTLFLRRTVVGIAMRAAAEDFSVTRLMGIRANRIIMAAFAASGLLAGVAGFLWVSQRGTVDPLLGFVPVLKAFIAAVIGGLGSLTGAVAAGFLLGSLEVMLQAYLPPSMSSYRDVFVWLFVLVILLWRPNGLFASREAVG